MLDERRHKSAGIRPGYGWTWGKPLSGFEAMVAAAINAHENPLGSCSRFLLD